MEKYFGIHVTNALLQHRPDEMDSVLLSDKRQDRRLHEIEQLARRNGIAIRRLPNSELADIARGNPHQGVITLCRNKLQNERGTDLPGWLKGLDNGSFIIALDGIIDPRNLGASLRSANAAGVGGVILPRNRGCSITATVSRTAQGAAETTPVFQASNLARVLDALKRHGYFVMGLDAAAPDSIYDTDLSEPCVLVFGAEETGLRSGTRSKCDQLISIPMLGKIASLNVSVAVGVAAFELMRQRAVS